MSVPRRAAEPLPRRAAGTPPPGPRPQAIGTGAWLGFILGVWLMVIGWAPAGEGASAPLPSAAAVTSATSSPPTSSHPASQAADQNLPSDQNLSSAERSHDDGTAHPIEPAQVPVAGELLEIASLRILAPVEPIGIVDGALAIPRDPGTLGRWRDGAGWTDPTGAVLVTGHVRFEATKGALWPLAAIEPGAPIRLVRDGTVVATWRVTSIRAVPRGTALPELFRTTGPPRLAVVTCGGQVVQGHYSHTVIVEAEPAPPQ